MADLADIARLLGTLEASVKNVDEKVDEKTDRIIEKQDRHEERLTSIEKNESYRRGRANVVTALIGAAAGVSAAFVKGIFH